MVCMVVWSGLGRPCLGFWVDRTILTQRCVESNSLTRGSYSESSVLFHPKRYII